jgi:hypothetical protein
MSAIIGIVRRHFENLPSYWRFASMTGHCEDVFGLANIEREHTILLDAKD